MANKHRKVWKVISWKPLSEKQTLPNLHKNKSKCYRLILEGFGRDMTELSPSISTTSFTQFTSYPWKKRSWSLQVGCVVPILQTISLPLPKHTGTCLRMSSTPLETQMNKLFHRKRRKLAIRYQLPKEGHASELYREHLIPFNSLYTQKKKHLQQQNHSISYDFVFKWQYNPRKGTKKCSINMVQTKTCRISLSETIITFNFTPSSHLNLQYSSVILSTLCKAHHSMNSRKITLK
jgi:hypothetical protein